MNQNAASAAATRGTEKWPEGAPGDEETEKVSALMKTTSDESEKRGERKTRACSNKRPDVVRAQFRFVEDYDEVKAQLDALERESVQIDVS